MAAHEVRTAAAMTRLVVVPVEVEEVVVPVVLEVEEVVEELGSFPSEVHLIYPVKFLA